MNIGASHSPIPVSTKAGVMNRKELLRLLLNQSQFNGFEFSSWFQSNIRPRGQEQSRRSPCSPQRAATTPCSSPTTSPAPSGAPAPASAFRFPAPPTAASTAAVRSLRSPASPSPPAPTALTSGSTTCARWPSTKTPSTISAASSPRRTRPESSLLNLMPKPPEPEPLAQPRHHQHPRLRHLFNCRAYPLAPKP